MNNDEFWSSVYSSASKERQPGRFSAVRVALLFGTAAAALALVVPPIADMASDEWILFGADPGIDYTTTASVPGNREYTVQRSVLQRSADSVCIIDSRGRRSGDC
ncbi:MAG: hypothetical protein NXI27_26465 [Alphaproteobacteria bacterium]|nr:hypothetical protein [Alphaproteobacteria bacterium]